MGNITISLDDKDEKKLRRIAKHRFGGRKGSMAQTVKAGIDKLEEFERKEAARKSLIESMEKGYKLGKIAVNSRAELYDRKIFG